MAVVTAIITGGLFWLTTASIPLAVLTGGAAFGAAWRFFDQLVA